MTVLITKFLRTKLQSGSPSYFFQIQYSIFHAELNQFNSRVVYLQTNEGFGVYLIVKHLLIRAFTQEMGTSATLQLRFLSFLNVGVASAGVTSALVLT